MIDIPTKPRQWLSHKGTASDEIGEKQVIGSGQIWKAS